MIIYRKGKENGRRDSLIRHMRIVIVFALLISMVGCSSNEKEQKEVIDTFFSAITSGDIRDIKKVMTTKASDEISFLTTIDSINKAFDWKYGESWEKEREGFVTALYDRFIDSYEVQQISSKNNKTIVKIKGKRLKYEDFQNDENFIDTNMGLSDFSNQKKALVTAYNNGEVTQDEYNLQLDKVYNDNAGAYFSAIKEELQKVKTTRFNITITLERDGKKWLIDAIDGRHEWPVFTDFYSINEDNEDYATYSVNPEKCKPENTILGKGRLFDSFNNEKLIETSFEFIDYNITNGDNKEVDEFGQLRLTEPIKVELEVSGYVGNTFILYITDDEDNVIVNEEITLTESQMVVTKELKGYYKKIKSIFIELLVKDNDENIFDYSNEFGYLFIRNG